jgi:hypothetical protein
MNFIQYQENAISDSVCDSLIALFENHPELHVKGTTGGFTDHNPDWKQDTEIGLSPDFLVPGMPWHNPLSTFLTSLGDQINKYKKTHSFYTEEFGVSGIDGIAPWRVYPTFNIQRYNPGEGYYAWHCETPNLGKQCISRMLVWMAYLNDVPDGGTEFKFQNLTTTAKKGSVVIWPPYWTHFHRGIVSPTTTKYIITGWCNFLPEYSPA